MRDHGLAKRRQSQGTGVAHLSSPPPAPPQALSSNTRVPRDRAVSVWGPSLAADMAELDSGRWEDQEVCV